MKSLILYGSPTKLTNAHKLVTNTNVTFRQAEYYVRAVQMNVGIDRALELAGTEIQPGEIVLNTVPVE